MTLAIDRSAAPFFSQAGDLSQARARRRHAFDADMVAYVAAAVDFLVVLGSSLVGALSYDVIILGVLNDPTKNIGIGLLTAAIFVLAMSSLHAYRHEGLKSMRRQAFLVCLLIPSVLAFLLTVIFFLKLGETFSRGAILNLALIAMISLVTVRLFWSHRLSKPVGWLRPKRALLICAGAQDPRPPQTFSSSGHLTIAQMIRSADDPGAVKRVCNDLLSENSGASAIDEVVIVWREGPIGILEDMLDELRRLPLPVKVIFDSFTGSVVSCQTQNVGGLLAFQVQSAPFARVERWVKRGFDVVFSVLALILLAPMLILVAAAIKIDSSGPVFFLQRRRGHGNQPFRIVKFRSMKVMDDGSDIRQATRDDARITRVGKFIRAYSIDELPQFWNVLRGEMSVVGPRPHAVAHDDLYDPLISDYASRRHVKPGVTGWAQINGCRGETPTVHAMEQRLHHDLWYIDNWSFWLDTNIVVRTMFAMRGGL